MYSSGLEKDIREKDISINMNVQVGKHFGSISKYRQKKVQKLQNLLQKGRPSLSFWGIRIIKVSNHQSNWMYDYHNLCAGTFMHFIIGSLDWILACKSKIFNLKWPIKPEVLFPETCV